MKNKVGDNILSITDSNFSCSLSCKINHDCNNRDLCSEHAVENHHIYNKANRW